MEIKKYQCEVGGELKDTKEEVSNTISFENHELKIFNYVCDKHYNEILEFAKSKLKGQ